MGIQCPVLASQWFILCGTLTKVDAGTISKSTGMVAPPSWKMEAPGSFPAGASVFLAASASVGGGQSLPRQHCAAQKISPLALRYSTRRLPKNGAIADWGTKPAISQLKGFNWEIGMDTPAEFRKHAVDCKKMAKVSGDPETKGAWKRMAERWLVCAKLAEDQDLFQRRRVEEKHSKTSPAPS
jgi:hypothetical protein